MGESYRIRTELGVNKTINVQLDQEFEFLEILSLKLQQEDIYLRACSDYGVVVGRVTANNGLGIPNARVSIFVPINVIDESNPVISSLYPYKSPTDKNEDGYRYNLLPYEKSHSAHSATGTLPSRLDVLTGKTISEIYDKYYKFTAKTNESGDYMIMGVPVGDQNFVMDVDLSDIGEFSLTPQDLIRMGLATESQVAGNRFRTSNDLNSLPQIVNLTKAIEISPLWGEPSICQIAINRLDFDLRDEANIDIQPTSVFMGSIFSTPETFRVRGTNGKVKDDFGNLCKLEAGPGSILAIRQTIQQDAEGNPILEQYQLEQNGNVIDGNGSWLVELPMNLDYFVTNEFGEKVLSNDPTIGIPTKGKYRFKIKWQQPADLTQQTRRPYYLVPNVREFGWQTSSSDPNYTNSTKYKALQESSYYFGLDWSGYTKGYDITPSQPQQKITRLNSIINCEDTFYQFDFNRVYTVSGLIDEYKNGGRGRFIGIKEIDSNDCAETINKFPVNEGFRNFDLIYFLFAFLMQIFQIIGLPLLVLYHFVAWLWNNFAVVIYSILMGFVTRAIIQTSIEAYAFIAAASANPFSWNMVIVGGTILLRLGFYTFLLIQMIKNFKLLTKKKFDPIKLPMVQYPDCQACQCSNGNITEGDAEDTLPPPGFITQTSASLSYQDKMNTYWTSNIGIPQDNDNFDGALQANSQVYAQALGGNPTKINNPTIFKTTKSSPISKVFGDGSTTNTFAMTYDLPVGEKINIYNLRQKYFNNYNKIKVTFNSPDNFNQNSQKFHFDNTLTVLSPESFEPGTLLTFINPNLSSDPNFKFTGTTAQGNLYNGIWGKIPTTARQINVKYATSQTSDQTISYSIPSGQTPTYVDSLTVQTDEIGVFTYNTCLGYPSTAATIVGITTISNINGINLDSISSDVEYTIKGIGNEITNYSYPADIEFYQVVTAITVTTKTINNQPVYSLPSLAPVNNNNQTANPSFWNLLTSNSKIITWGQCDAAVRNWWNTFPTDDAWNNPVDFTDFNTTYLDSFSEQKILILQRGVDPYSPTYVNRYGIGKILGHASEDDVVITAETRLNIPIQKLPTGSSTTVQKHDNQSNIFYGSYFFTPGIPGNNTTGFSYTSYSTFAVGFYGALDSTPSSIIAGNIGFYSGNYVSNQNGGVFSDTSNLFYSQPTGGLWPSGFFTGSLDTKYDNSEDLSGGAVLWGKLSYGRGPIRRNKSRCGGAYNAGTDQWNGDWARQVYFSPNLLPSLSANPLSVTNSTLNIMRTDRLPSSDYADNGDNWFGSVSLLQQNLGFKMYNIAGGESVNGLQFSTGAQIPTADIEGQYAAINVFNSLNTCDKMVGLTCYSGNGTSFGVKTGCEETDAIDNGCYVMVRKPLTDLFNGKDFKTFAEWGYRFRFFYALCRGVLAQSFTNNWVNGTLFMFPIQVDRYFDRNNKPLPPSYPKNLIYFDNATNNFYFRSSPFISGATNPFPGKSTVNDVKPVNSRNLLFPTTIINLGMKDSFYDEVMFEPSTAAFIMNNLNPTSYSDTSDIVNLFVISRITDEGFLQQLIPLKDNALNQLFSRFGTTLFVERKSRVDADLAQMMSINSEIGIIPFSPEFYPINGGPNDPVKVIGQLNNPTMGIYFSSTTFNLQDKDFLSPGIINFRPNPNNTAITYEYNIKSQVVPFYQWEIKQGQSQNIFGTERNNWATTSSDIKYGPYQSLSRRSQVNPHYYIPSNTTLDIYQRGYIFDVDANGNFLVSPPRGENSKIVVGAPNHFYFGIIKGETALDKFKTKYGLNE